MKTLLDKYYEVSSEILDAVKKLPNIDLRDHLRDEYDEDMDDDDILFDFPYTYTTDKNAVYLIHLVLVKKLNDNEFLCVGTGEDFGEEFTKNIDEISLESLLDFYKLVKS